MDLRATHHQVAGHDVVALDGIADLAAAPQLQSALSRSLSALETNSLIVDLDAATVVDDVAIGLLLGTATRCRDRGIDFAIVASTPKIAARLADTRVDRIVTVRSSIA